MLSSSRKRRRRKREGGREGEEREKKKKKEKKGEGGEGRGEGVGGEKEGRKKENTVKRASFVGTTDWVLCGILDICSSCKYLVLVLNNTQHSSQIDRWTS